MFNAFLSSKKLKILLFIFFFLIPLVYAPKAQAANFTMQTGYYMGTGSSLSITGVGFQPQFVLIKADTAAGTAAFNFWGGLLRFL